MSILLVKIRISDLVIYMFRNVIFVLIMLNKIKILQMPRYSYFIIIQKLSSNPSPAINIEQRIFHYFVVCIHQSLNIFVYRISFLQASPPSLQHTSSCISCESNQCQANKNQLLCSTIHRREKCFKVNPITSFIHIIIRKSPSFSVNLHLQERCSPAIH